MFTPLSPENWNTETAAHLLNRAAFGGSPAEIESVRAKTMTEAVRDLADVRTDSALPPAPACAHPQNIRDVYEQLRMLNNETAERKEKRREIRMAAAANLLDLRHWWLDWMMTTPAPLVEKMTLFWHGHFATSVDKVRDDYWMWRQNDTLRRHALGNFGTLTKEISRDPAMMIYLDLQQNQKAHPNENWARELMELFTVGIGNYTEQDVRESARAFTGYRIDLTTQQFRYAPLQHDGGSKIFMRRMGDLDGDDIIDALLQKPACANFIGRKLWRFFVEDEPSPQIVEAVGDRIRAHRYEMRPVLREIFSSEEFYSERVRRNQIKSPMQFLVQTAKLLEAPLPSPTVAQNSMRQMGQLLFAPPNVKGWDGGKSWISTSTLLFRYNFANYLINGDAMRPIPNAKNPNGAIPAFRGRAALPPEIQREPINVSKLIPADLRAKAKELVAYLSIRLFQTELSPAEAAGFVQYLEAQQPDTGDETMRSLLHLMMSTPQFQLT